MFFDDNIGFLSLFGPNNMNSNMPDILDSKEGFLKANMFRNEYVPYKNYEPAALKANNEKEAYLYKIMELSFAIDDLNLYLDLHSNDTKVYDILRKYVSELNEIQDEYVKKYGPLEICDADKVTTDKWTDGQPFEKEDAFYV